MALNFCNNNSLSAITSIPAAISGGSLNLISTQTASSSATIDFTSGIDSTYKEYIFKFINLHPATDNSKLFFQVTTNGTDFNTTLTSTYFIADHDEADSSTTLSYVNSDDQAQGTSFQRINESTGADNDESISGMLHLFDPSNTTFVKHYIAESSSAFEKETHTFTAGYFNTTSAVTGVQFKFGSGNIDSGVIKLYGVS
jgi:hypothetical protein